MKGWFAIEAFMIVVLAGALGNVTAHYIIKHFDKGTP